MAGEMIAIGIEDSDGHPIFLRKPFNMNEIGIVTTEGSRIVKSIYVENEKLPALIKKLEEQVM